MNAQDIRKAYLDFFAARGHAVIPRAKVVPDNDPSTLFTGSGMQPMIPYLLGEPHPEGLRLADSQTCLRAQDIDEVGDNRHTTFFEMLGNWSLGDYFKAEQVPWMFEFLIEVVKLDPTKLYVTCFIGAPEYDIPKDTEVAKIWQGLFKAVGIDAAVADIGSEDDGYKRGIKPGERIFYYDGSKNWWSRNGKPETTPVGDPCGPDSEMFYDFGDLHMHQQWVSEKVSLAQSKHSSGDNELLAREIEAEFANCHPNCDCGRFMEIGNNVFMAYRKESEGKFVPLEKPNIDHGSGLERIAAAAIDSPDVFKISILWPIIEMVEKISGKSYDSSQASMRVIADHLRAATFMAVDGISPSNKQQGYVMRRLVRRAMIKAFDLGVEQNFLEQVVPVIADLYRNDFPEVEANRDAIIATLIKEEKAFRQTLRKGLQVFDKLMLRTQGSLSRPGSETKVLDGLDIFKLYDTFGFPVELSLEEAFKRGDITVFSNWEPEFDHFMQEQRERSQTAAKGTFKGGLGGQSDIHKKYHTATHLLQSALRQLYGTELRQHGSNITEDRLRFDFNHDAKMTPEEKQQAEDLVNGWIAEDLPVKFTEYPTQQALDMGAIGPFGERYAETVKVYQMGSDDHIASLEICGGPHVDHTGQLAEDGKKFKISKEESSSAGIRRIKAVLV